jgi:hypothetical protein
MTQVMSEDFPQKTPKSHTQTQAKTMATLPPLSLSLTVGSKCVDMSVNPTNDPTPMTSSNSIAPYLGNTMPTPLRQSTVFANTVKSEGVPPRSPAPVSTRIEVG